MLDKARQNNKYLLNTRNKIPHGPNFLIELESAAQDDGLLSEDEN